MKEIASPSNDQLLMQKLEQLRTKLLDLSLANRLLNFRHSPQGRSFVRVIDDTPDLLWERLQHQPLAFRPLPSMEEDPEDESEPTFIQAWQAARLSDAKYQADIQALESQEDSFQREEKLHSIERALKDRLRQVLGLPSRLSLTQSITEHAKLYGIDPSFDLPKQLPAGKVSHEEIQLLLFPKAAEQQLSYVRDAARQRIEETGINMLFCAFGFLQWVETIESSTPLYAPLLLLPVELKREIKQHQFVYTLSLIDEEPLINLTLKEKLRQLGFILPEWEEKDTPETYWQRMETIIPSNKKWQVRRWITVGIFPFSRMAMYEDLDPTHPQLLKHAQTRELLLGHEISQAGLSDHLVEEEKSRINPLFISKVDSSQYAAICKALQCPSLVIKGPPGTGKSQTITNLIAASLAQGENVLFVADKQAALNVVYSRLKEAGLGDFCLELHSHQATRMSVIQSLKKRLEIPPTKTLAHLEEKLAEAEALHQSLDQYTHFIQRPLGRSQMTIQETLWAARQASERTEFPAILFKTYFDHVDQITPETIQKAKRLLKGIEKAYHIAIGTEGNLHEHPWRGIGNSPLSPFQMEELCDLFQSLIPLLKQIESTCRCFNECYAVKLSSLEEAEQFSNQLSQALAFMEHIQPDVLPYCKSEEWQEKIKDFLQTIEQLENISHALQMDFSLLSSFPMAKLEMIDTLCKSLPTTIHSTARLNQEIEHSLRQIYGLEQLHQLSIELARELNLEGNLAIGALKSIWSAVTYLSRIPPSLFKWRHPSLYHENSYDALYKAHQKALDLQSLVHGLKKRFKLEKWDATIDLSACIQQLERNSFWKFLTPSFRKARKIYQEISFYPNAQPQTMAAHLRELDHYFTNCLQFEKDALIRQLSGPHFAGIETDFASLMEAAQFGLEVKRRFGNSEKIHQTICSMLLEGKEENLLSLAGYSKHSMAFALTQFLSSPHDSLEHTLVDLIDSWKVYLKKLTDLKQSIEEKTLPSSFQLEDLSHWLAKGKDIQQVLKKLEELQSIALALNFSPHHFSRSQIQNTLLYCQQVRRLSSLTPLADRLLSPSIKMVQEELKSFARSLKQQVEAIKDHWKAIQSIGDIEEKWFFSHPHSFVQQTWEALLSRLETCLQQPEQLNNWSILGEALAAAKREGLEIIYGPLIEANQPLESLCKAYELVLYRSLARYAYAIDNGLLSRFNGIDQEQALLRLAALDREIIQLSKERLRNLLLERAPPAGVGYGKKSAYTELALIKHEVNKQKRHISIRQLMQRAKEALRALKPCFLMSPLSLAQYLPRDSLTFDLLVIDEASQMRPEEAIGAISRAKRVVIVGDPMQLPPTDFFMKMENPHLEDEEIEESVNHDSILDLALAVFRDTCELRWHYRSQHESLIAFSNRYFYDNRLIVFPSAHPASDHVGVKWVPVNGIYQSGMNPMEAQAVIQAVIECMERFPERSLGIVTLNCAQRDLLLEEFEYAIRHSPQAANYMARWESTLQSPFIKNLENVQGDERDVIFISMVYGPNEEGIVAQHFGPINKMYGHRRLNVLFTRARSQLIVFSSLLPNHIKIEGRHPGVGILKNYLEYASTGRLDTGWNHGSEPESDFERCVAEKIQAMGCQVIPQVGVAGYRIDIGVRHPNYPYGYLLGIECDGATYHSSQDARERDRLRQEILEQLGWTIYRIWSTDWFRDPVTQTKRLKTFIEDLIASKEKISNRIYKPSLYSNLETFSELILRK
jgi:superfamily I DNA and/or RNA helicase/very-short-patch-repair endonuclease